MKIIEITDPGKRGNNEDAVGHILSNGKFCGIVCDGLGGHDCGEIASGLVRDTMLDSFKANDEVTEENLSQMIVMAQEKLMKAKENNPKWSNMMTTLTSIISDGTKIIIGHVGDSRIVLFDGKRVVHKSKDHSVVGALYESGQITAEEMLHHPDRNRLIRSMGMEWDGKKYEINSFDKKESGVTHAVLCSDGFWENFPEDRLGKLLISWKSDDRKKSVIHETIRKSDYYDDNYTGLLIKF